MFFQPFVRKIWMLSPIFLSKLFLLFFRNSSSPIGFVIRYLCVSKLARCCGEKVIISPSVFFTNIQNISLGTNVVIGAMSYLDGYGGISIGNDVAIAHGCTVVSSDHAIDEIGTTVKDSHAIADPVIIGDDVWLGARVIVLKGVTLGSHSVIGAGAVVASDILDWSVSIGVPAKHMRFREHGNE
jgi:acetyltransferase-like isoleucine patch superfamily enzyme